MDLWQIVSLCIGLFPRWLIICLFHSCQNECRIMMNTLLNTWSNRINGLRDERINCKHFSSFSRKDNALLSLPLPPKKKFKELDHSFHTTNIFCCNTQYSKKIFIIIGSSYKKNNRCDPNNWLSTGESWPRSIQHKKKTFHVHKYVLDNIEIKFRLVLSQRKQASRHAILSAPSVDYFFIIFNNASFFQWDQTTKNHFREVS